MAYLDRGGVRISYQVLGTRRGDGGLAMAARGVLTQRDGRVIEALPSIDVPVLVLVGAQDTPFLAAASYLAAKVPGAEHAVIPGAGHVSNADQPELFNQHVLGFLARVDPR
jgi:pimeloyl-ACP methyl ester carboxylesterase